MKSEQYRTLFVLIVPIVTSFQVTRGMSQQEVRISDRRIGEGSDSSAAFSSRGNRWSLIAAPGSIETVLASDQDRKEWERIVTTLDRARSG